ncbi:hypothetical protein, partial [Bradyrhizobium sp. 162]|uniref:hypothetical protein n=1 Tax=Bradyrhizobium sp. 162 TaxID=2782635 RepID=UPI001FFAD31B
MSRKLDHGLGCRGRARSFADWEKNGGHAQQGNYCHSACNIGSDSLLMKFKRRLVLVSQRNQYDAASPTSVGS